MSDPATLDEYNKKIQRNQRVSGFGPFGTTMHLPCPGCAASDWKSYKVIEAEQRMPEPATCSHCLRTFEIPVTRTPGGVSFKFVQTGGEPVADYLKSFIEREEL